MRPSAAERGGEDVGILREAGFLLLGRPIIGEEPALLVAGESIEADHVAVSHRRLEPGRVRLELQGGHLRGASRLVPGGANPTCPTRRDFDSEETIPGDDDEPTIGCQRRPQEFFLRDRSHRLATGGLVDRDDPLVGLRRIVPASGRDHVLAVAREVNKGWIGALAAVTDYGCQELVPDPLAGRGIPDPHEPVGHGR